MVKSYLFSIIDKKKDLFLSDLGEMKELLERQGVPKGMQSDDIESARVAAGPSEFFMNQNSSINYGIYEQ